MLFLHIKISFFFFYTHNIFNYSFEEKKKRNFFASDSVENWKLLIVWKIFYSICYIFVNSDLSKMSFLFFLTLFSVIFSIQNFFFFMCVNAVILCRRLWCALYEMWHKAFVCNELRNSKIELNVSISFAQFFSLSIKPF